MARINLVSAKTNCTKGQFRRLMNLGKKYYRETDEDVIEDLYNDNGLQLTYEDYGSQYIGTIERVGFDFERKTITIGVFGAQGGGAVVNNETCYTDFDRLIETLEEIVNNI